MEEKQKRNEAKPYKADVCVQTFIGNMQNMEFSNTLCILAHPLALETIKDALDHVPDQTYTIKHQSQAYVLVSVRVSKLISFSAVVGNVVALLKKAELIVVKS